MTSLKIGYRVLISNYGYFGSINKPYVCYEIKEGLDDDDVIGQISLLHDNFKSDLQSEEIECDTPLNAKNMLEHALIYFQNRFYKRYNFRFDCLHSKIKSNEINTRDQDFLVVPFLHRMVATEILDHVRLWINREIDHHFSEEFDKMIDKLLPDNFIFKLTKNIPSYDVEDDSTLFALGEGTRCIIIKNKLINNQINYLTQPFPSFKNFDKIIWKVCNIDLSKGIDQLDNILEFKLLIENPMIPKFLITGTNGKTTTSRMITHIIRTISKSRIGLASTSGIFVDGEDPDVGDFTGPWSARIVLQKPIDVAVLETARGGLIREGVIFEKVSIATITNVAADHLGIRNINTVAEMAELKSLILHAATDGIILNADEPLVHQFNDLISDGTFGTQPNAKVWGISNNAQQIENYAYALYIQDQQIMIKEVGDSKILGELSDFKFSQGGLISFMNINALSAMAACISYGFDKLDVYNAMVRFEADITNAPGRGNFFAHKNRWFILDYGHNPHALKQIKKTIENIRNNYPIKRVIFLALTAGDRDDEHQRNIAWSLYKLKVDHIILKDLWIDLRGREVGEVGLIIEEELKQLGYTGGIHQKPDPVEAIRYSIQISKPDDLVYLCAEKADIMYKEIMTFNFKSN